MKVSMNVELLAPQTKILKDVCNKNHCGDCPIEKECDELRSNLSKYYITVNPDKLSNSYLKHYKHDFANTLLIVDSLEQSLNCDSNCQSCTHNKICVECDKLAYQIYNILISIIKLNNLLKE